MLLVLVGVFLHVRTVHAQPKMPKERIPGDVPAEVRAEIERLRSADPAERWLDKLSREK